VDPTFALAHVNLGLVYLDQGKHAEAIACARSAIGAEPKFSNGHAFLGRSLQQAGDIAGARAALTEAVRLDRKWAGMLAGLPPLPAAPAPHEVKRPDR
jgi:predicted Zn-dependent protease